MGSARNAPARQKKKHDMASASRISVTKSAPCLPRFGDFCSSLVNVRASILGNAGTLHADVDPGLSASYDWWPQPKHRAATASYEEFLPGACGK